MTTVSAIAPAPAPMAPPSSPAPSGPSFEATLTQALSSPVGGQVQVQAPSVPSTSSTTPAAVSSAGSSTGSAVATSGSSQVLSAGAAVPADAKSDGAAVSLPSDAIAAFLAVFLAMASQALVGQTPPGAAPTGDGGAAEVGSAAQVGAAAQVASMAQIGSTAQGGAAAQVASGLNSSITSASTAAVLKTVLADLRQVSAPHGADELNKLLVSLVAGSRDSASTNGAPHLSAGDAAKAGDKASEVAALLDQLAVQLGLSAGIGAQPPAIVLPSGHASAPAPSVTSIGLGKLADAIGSAVQRLDGLAQKVAGPGEVTKEIAGAAADFARELTAASGTFSTKQPLGTTPASADATLARLGAAIEAAKTLAHIAEIGSGMNLGQMKGTSEVSVQLNPDLLGKLDIRLERTSQGITAHVQATTEAGRQAVEANLGAITAALGTTGTAVNAITVAGPATAQITYTVQPPPAGAPGDGGPIAQPVATTLVDGAKAQAAPVNAAAAPASDLRRRDASADTTTTDSSAPQLPIPPQNTNRLEAANAPAPSAPPPAPRLVHDITQQVVLLAGQGKSEFQLQLRPEALGRLHLKLSVEDGGVTINMRAESPEAKASIEAHLPQLKQSFHDQGIRVDRFVIEVSQGQFSQDSQHPRRSRGWVDDVRTSRDEKGEENFAEALAVAGSVRPVDYRA